MKLIMTLKIRDEGDVIDENLRFHLAAGVDFFIITDNGSVDETPEILERYRKAGLAQILEKPADEFYRPNPEWVTDMARLAATEHDADWVINNDADEFWWPLAGDLKTALESVPERYMAVAAPRPEFVARPDGPGPFYERMTIRERLSTVRPKLAHRAHPEIVAPSGAHRVALPGAGAPGHRGRPWLRSAVEDTIEAEGWLTPAPVFPMRILHYPVRSYDQYRRRVEISLAGERHTGDERAQEIYAALAEDRLEEVYANYAPQDAAVADAIERGHLVEDTRIRDVIRASPGLRRRSRPPQGPAAARLRCRRGRGGRGGRGRDARAASLGDSHARAPGRNPQGVTTARKESEAPSQAQPQAQEEGRLARGDAVGASPKSSGARAGPVPMSAERGLPKVVMTYKLRDEADVIADNVRYHVGQGIDTFLASDNSSTDGTREILAGFESVASCAFSTSRRRTFGSESRHWLTNMARFAAEELGADWVIHNDADEFWWPVQGTIPEALAGIPPEFGAVISPRSEFRHRPEDDRHFAERMDVRETRARLRPKVAHRAEPNVVVLHRGAHDVALAAPDGDGLAHPVPGPPGPAGSARRDRRGRRREARLGSKPSAPDLSLPAPDL